MNTVLEARKQVLFHNFNSEQEKLDYKVMGVENWQKALGELNAKYISLLIEIYRKTPWIVWNVSSHSYNGTGEGCSEDRVRIPKKDVPIYPAAKIVGYRTQTWDSNRDGIYHPSPHITRVVTRKDGVVVGIRVDEYVPDGGVLVEPVEITSFSYSVGDGELSGSISLKIPAKFSDRMRLKYPGAVEKVYDDPPLGDSWGHQWQYRIAYLNGKEVWSISRVLDCQGPGYSCSYSHGPFECEGEGATRKVKGMVEA